VSSILKKFPNDPPRPNVVKGDGIFIHLENGKKLLDTTAGWTSYAVLGYSHPEVLEAMKVQMTKFCHMDYNIWNNPQIEELADLMLSRAPHGLDKVYFGGTSGSDAIEAAMKLSYHVHHDSGKPEKTGYISRAQSFDGATLHAMSVSDLPILDLYRPLLPTNFGKIPEHNPIRHKKPDESLDEYARRGAKDLEDKILEMGPDRVAAFVGETILGSLVGDVPAAPNYWKYIREVCDRYDVHIILDEVYCGMGRSGRIYAYDWDDFRPDFVCIGKNFAAGYAPMSAVVTNGTVEDIIAKGSGRIQLGHTYQGFSLGVAAALAVQKIVHTDDMLAQINKIGAFMRETLVSELGSHPFFREVRGRGLIFALEYDCPNVHPFSLELQRVMEEEHDILINSKWHRASFVPAYIMDNDQTELVLDRFIDTFRTVAARHDGADDDFADRPGAFGGVKAGS
jgi:adenosylmethionine-8-amino-7-oxononanoate aminotransferase